jgi:hypothetical protein
MRSDDVFYIVVMVEYLKRYQMMMDDALMRGVQ